MQKRYGCTDWLGEWPIRNSFETCDAIEIWENDTYYIYRFFSNGIKELVIGECDGTLNLET